MKKKMNRECAFEQCDQSVEDSEQWLEIFDRYVRPAQGRQNGTFARVCRDCFREHNIRSKIEETPQPPVAANFREREAFNQTIRKIWGPNFLEKIDIEATSVY